MYADPSTRVDRAQGKHILINAGTKPASSPKVPLNGRTIVNSDQVLELAEPREDNDRGGRRRSGQRELSLTRMFAALGVRVTLIERRPRLLEFADQEIIEALSYHLREPAWPCA